MYNLTELLIVNGLNPQCYHVWSFLHAWNGEMSLELYFSLPAAGEATLSRTILNRVTDHSAYE